MVTTSPAPHLGWKPRLSHARAGPRPQDASAAGLVPTSPPSPDLPNALRVRKGSSSVCCGVASGGAQGPPHPGEVPPPLPAGGDSCGIHCPLPRP